MGGSRSKRSRLREAKQSKDWWDPSYTRPQEKKAERSERSIGKVTDALPSGVIGRLTAVVTSTGETDSSEFTVFEERVAWSNPKLLKNTEKLLLKGEDVSVTMRTFVDHGDIIIHKVSGWLFAGGDVVHPLDGRDVRLRFLANGGTIPEERFIDAWDVAPIRNR